MTSAKARRARARSWIGAFLTTVAIAACNLDDEFISSGGFGGVGAVGTVVDSGKSTVPREICESAALDTTCIPSMVCEIGEHPNPACNSLLRCDAGRGRWEEEQEALACDEEECPTAFTLERNGACDGPSAPTLRCAYPEQGYTCGCAPFFTEPGDGGADGGTDGGGEPEDAGKIADAGADADAGPTGRIPAGYAWTCVKPQSGCPRTRPPVGTRCVLPMDCDYGECVFESKTNVGGLHLECEARGFWRIRSSRCD
jgi:hypothetical protein